MSRPSERPRAPRRRAAVAVGFLLVGGFAPAADAASLDLALAAAAEASRREGLAGARRELAAWTAPPASAADAAAARTVLGLLAWSHGESEAAAELLASGESAPPELGDWRLWALAQAHAAGGRTAAARAALDELLAGAPASPLVPRAVVRRVELAVLAGDTAAARAQIAAARREQLPRETRSELERKAWQLAVDTGDSAELAEAARHLLVVAPLEAARLRVVDVVAARRAAASDWRLWLAPEELVARAAALVEIDLPAGALTTLAAVPAERRDLGWRLLEAQALTASGRSADAYATLAGPLPAGADGRAELEWERARAAGEARRGRTGAEADRWRRLEREHLLAVARHGGAGALAALALERLAGDYLDDGRTAEAVAALRQLLALRPDANAGARRLWEHGWAAYERGDAERALALWHDLAELYPRSSWTRAGRYWTARERETRGGGEEAKRIYLELLATDVADFYARQAGLRLAGATRTLATAPPERERWPESPALARAARLSSLGLDELARDEIALVGERAEPRAAAALAAVVLARMGERRTSLGELRRAFSDLGTPHQARVPEEALALFYPTDYRPQVTAAAARERLAASLVFGMIHQESAFDAAARSRSGARGLMQLMPSTGQEVARRLGVPFSTARLEDPETSLRLGTRYFRQLLDRFDGNVELALAGYNGGPGRISRLWRAAGPGAELDRFLESLTVSESRSYVKRILVLADGYRSLYPDLG
jgi:soluble lytic murein transglycosylase